MNQINKNTVLLLGHNKWQERALVLTLKLGGYAAHAVEDVNEAINLVKTLPETVHSMVLPWTGCQVTLMERLSSLEANQISTPVYVIGTSVPELERNKISVNSRRKLRLSCCRNDQLLDCLNQCKMSENKMTELKRSQTSEESESMVLTGSFTGNRIEEAVRELTKVVMSSSMHIIIDCHELEEIDDKGLKFLCSAHRYITSCNRTVGIIGLSPQIVLDARSHMDKFLPGLTCNKTNHLQCVWKI